MRLPSINKPWPFSRYQIALVLLAVLPLVAVFGLLARWRGQDLRDSGNQGMLRTAEALSLVVDREIGIVRSSLETLAESEAIDRRDIAAFSREASRVAERWPGSWIVLTDRSGPQLINTSLPAGTPLPNRLAMDSAQVGERELPIGTARDIRKVFAVGTANNSHLFTSIAQKRPVIAVNAPVVRDGAIGYVVSITFPPQGLIDLISVGLQGAGRRTTLIDGNGFIVARSQEPELVATRVPATFGVPLEDGPATGIRTVTALTGEPAYLAYARSPVTGWTVAFTVLKADADREVATGLLRTGVVGVIGLVLSILLALWFGRRLRSPMLALAAKASGKPAAMPGTAFLSSELVEIDRAIDAGSRAREAEAIERERRLAAEARREEADAANRAKDQFLAMVGHELRNPLAAISNAATVMGQAPATGPSMIPIMKRQLEHLRKLVDDLLDVARVTSGKFALVSEEVDLFELAATCVADFVRTGRSADHQLNVKGENVCIYADSDRMAQVLTNLVDNALKFTPATGTITVSVMTEGPEALLRVEDTGDGILGDELLHIFDVFVQGHQPLDRARGGLGLGLALAKSLVEAQHGHISAASEGPGKGAVFTVRMPRIQCEERGSERSVNRE